MAFHTVFMDEPMNILLERSLSVSSKSVFFTFLLCFSQSWRSQAETQEQGNQVCRMKWMKSQHAESSLQGSGRKIRNPLLAPIRIIQHDFLLLI